MIGKALLNLDQSILHLDPEFAPAEQIRENVGEILRLKRVANRLTLGLVIAATIIGAAMLIQVPTQHRFLGYPVIAMVLFAVAVLGGGALATWIVVTDRKVASTERRTPPPDSP